jgi:hypothetical protein
LCWSAQHRLWEINAFAASERRRSQPEFSHHRLVEKRPTCVVLVIVSANGQQHKIAGSILAWV